jgi:hypothetical protein
MHSLGLSHIPTFDVTMYITCSRRCVTDVLGVLGKR